MRKSTLLLLLVRFLSLSFGFGANLLLARVLGTEQFGVYSYVMFAMSLVAMVGTLGFPTLLVRDISQLEAAGRSQEITALIKSTREISLVCTVVFIMAIGYASLNLMLPDSLYLKPMLPALLVLPLSVLLILQEHIYRGYDLPVIAQIPQHIILKGLFLLVVATSASGLFDGEYEAADFIGWQIAVSLLGLAFGTLAMSKYLRSRPTASQPHFRQDRSILLNKAFPFLLISVVFFLNRQIDFLVLGALGTPSEAGIYRVTMRGAELVFLSWSVVVVVVQPKIARAFATGDVAEAWRITKISATVVACISAPIAAGLCAFSTEFLSMFGNAYIAGENALKVLAIGYLVAIVLLTFEPLLTMTTNERLTLFIIAGGVVLNLILNLLLVPRYGLNGSACAAAVSLSVSHAVIAITATKICREHRT